MLTFLHGFLGSPQDWHPVCQHLNSSCTLLTLPGHQNKPCDLTLLEKEIPSNTTLIGYSLGGRLAMQFASRYPERIERLIILSAHPGLDNGKEKRLKTDESWVQLLKTEGMEKFLKKWYQQPLFSTLDPRLTQNREPHDPQLLAKVLKNLSPAKLPSMWKSLQDFSFPILFLFGERDIKYKPIATRLRKRFPVEFIPNCGHAIHLENPSLCAQKIQAFIGEPHDQYN